MSDEQKNERSGSMLVYILGGIIGGLAGVFAAKLLIDRARDENKESLVNFREGAQIGALVLTFIRGIGKLAGK